MAKWCAGLAAGAAGFLLLLGAAAAQTEDEEDVLAVPDPPPAEGISLPGLEGANGHVPSGGKKVDQPVNIYFPGTELGKVVQAICAATGKNYQFDPQMASTPVTLISHAPIEPEYLLDLLQSVLTTYGMTMVETLDGNLIKIRPLGTEPEKPPLYIGGEIPQGFEDFATHIVPVRYARVEDLSNLLPALGSSNASVDAYGPTNTLVLTDNAHGLRRMLRFINEVDLPGSDVVIETFPLQHARAEAVAQQITEVLTASGDGGQGQPGRAIRTAPRIVPGQSTQTVVAAQEAELRVVPDERLNLLMVASTESLMDQVRQLIDRLDMDIPPGEHNLHVYNLRNADAESLAEKLNGLFGNVSAAPQAGRGRNPQAQPGNAPALEQPFASSVTIEAYEATNSLLVVASPQDYDRVSAFVDQLDRPARQVHVGALILEVRLQDTFELGVELMDLAGTNAFALNNIVSLGNLMANGPMNYATSGAPAFGLSAGILDGTVTLPVPDGAGGWIDQTFPKIPIFLRALDTITDTDVLSQPMLTTVDNEEATMVIGEEVPVTTGSQTRVGGTGDTLYQNIERKEVGVIMRLTPQISQGDYVVMNLEVEVSSVAAPTEATGDVNILGPTFTKSNVTNKVVIRDGSTGIVGGLIQDVRQRTKRQTPIVGDIPVLGLLFRRKADEHRKRNLVVLVMPNIVKDGVDVERITKARLEEARSANVDAVFETGFITKTKKRHSERLKSRPSTDRIRELMEESRFEKGTVSNAAP